MKITILTLLLTTLLFSCNNNGGKKQKADGLVTPRQEKVAAVFTLPDSSKNMEVMLRVIGVGLDADSANNKYVPVVDTAWYIVRAFADTLANGSPVLDSLGKPKTKETYFQRSKDSVNWRISGISIDSLLSKKYPPKGR